jgi:hypothetical protein
VPNATAADSATRAAAATNADAVGGFTVRKFFAKVPVGGPTTEIFRGTGFVLRGGCSAANATLSLTGIAGAPETSVAFEGSDGVAPGAPVSDSNADLDPNDNVSLIAGPAGTGTAVASTTTGVVSTIVYAGQGAPAFQGENVCVLRGTVTAG